MCTADDTLLALYLCNVCRLYIEEVAPRFVPSPEDAVRVFLALAAAQLGIGERGKKGEVAVISMGL